MSRPTDRLTDDQRTYLETGDAPRSHRPHELEPKIATKINHLPARIDALFEDIDVLAEAEYLDVENWGDSWFELFDVDTDDDIAAQFTYSLEDSLSYPAASVTFGKQLGEMVAQLMLYPKAMEYSDVQTDIVWGFIQGIAPRSARETTQFKMNCTERLEARASAEKEARAETTEQFKQHVEKMKDVGEQREKRIREYLDAINLEPTSRIVSDMKNGLEEELGIEYEYGCFVGRESTVEKITPELVHKIVDERRLAARQTLRKYLSDGNETLESTTYDDEVSAADVLRGIPANGMETIREIAEREEMKNPTVAKLGEFLASDSTVSGDEWHLPPVVRVEKPDGVSFADWMLETTPFGTALRSYSNAHETMRQITPLHPIPETVLDNALDEIESEMY